MDNTPKIFAEDSLTEHLAEMADAMKTAATADAIEVTHPTTGVSVKSLKLRLSPEHTKQVMSQPPHLRAAMAESILVERAQAKAAREKTEREVSALRKARKAKARRVKLARRKNR